MNIPSMEAEDGSKIAMPGVIEGTMLTRVLPDGRVICLIPRMFGAIDLTLQPHIESVGPEQVWTYESQADALGAALTWDGSEGEPMGWIRHRPSNRRREDGDPNRETIRE